MHTGASSTFLQRAARHDVYIHSLYFIILCCGAATTVCTVQGTGPPNTVDDEVYHPLRVIVLFSTSTFAREEKLGLLKMYCTSTCQNEQM